VSSRCLRWPRRRRAAIAAMAAVIVLLLVTGVYALWGVVVVLAALCYQWRLAPARPGWPAS
jgi:hypothetical protein